jgi:predicted transcriptional regulator
VTLVLAVIGYAGLRLLPAARDAGGLAALIFSNLYRVNLFLLLFNLIPAFPMDGGRVLRALMVPRAGYVRATHYAAQVGRVIAVGFAVIGIVGLKPWFAPGDWILILIALFVWSSGTSEARAVAFRTAATALTAGQVMLHPFETIPAWTPLDHLAARLQSKVQRDFPVVGHDGTIVGLLTRDHLARGLDEGHPMTEVQGVMATHFPLLSETLPFAAAFEALIASRLPALPVVDASGAVIGLFTKDRVAELMTRPWPLPS